MPKYQVYCIQKVYHHAEIEAPTKEAALQWAQDTTLDMFRAQFEAEYEYPEPKEFADPRYEVDIKVNKDGEEIQ